MSATTSVLFWLTNLMPIYTILVEHFFNRIIVSNSFIGSRYSSLRSVAGSFTSEVDDPAKCFVITLVIFSYSPRPVGHSMSRDRALFFALLSIMILRGVYDCSP